MTGHDVPERFAVTFIIQDCSTGDLIIVIPGRLQVTGHDIPERFAVTGRLGERTTPQQTGPENNNKKLLVYFKRGLRYE